MSETPLLERLFAAPDDPTSLLVYCDWLEEQGDPRHRYARLQLDLARGVAEKTALLAHYPHEHPAWTGRLELASVFEPNLTELPAVWFGVSVGERQAGGTYQGFDGAGQPPLPVSRFDGSWTWLAEATNICGDPQPPDDAPEWADGWRSRIEAIRLAGYRVPGAFEALITDLGLQANLPSCTDNYFIAAKDAELHPNDDGSAFLTFWSDSQACILWGLRISKHDAYNPVLAGAPEFPDDDHEREPLFRFPDLCFSSPTLEQFVYRTWLENTVWFAMNWDDSARPLTDEEERYLAHFTSS